MGRVSHNHIQSEYKKPEPLGFRLLLLRGSVVVAQQGNAKRHTVKIENRERLTASGVERVDFLSGELITAHTSAGRLNIKGDGLYVENLNADTGELLVKGHVIAMSYTDGVQPMGFFKRLLK